jgi:hypothetical protein
MIPIMTKRLTKVFVVHFTTLFISLLLNLFLFFLSLSPSLFSFFFSLDEFLQLWKDLSASKGEKDGAYALKKKAQEGYDVCFFILVLLSSFLMSFLISYLVLFVVKYLFYFFSSILFCFVIFLYVFPSLLSFFFSFVE